MTHTPLLSTFLLLLLLLAITVSCRANDDANVMLLQAAMNNDLDNVIKALEQNGVDINIQDTTSGQTPLMAAVLRGNFDIVQVLLQHNADVTIGEKDGYTPAHGAGFQGRSEIMRLLYNHGIDVLNDKHSDGYLPLHRACWGREQRHADTVQVLLELGVNPDVPSENGRTCQEMTHNPATLQVLRKDSTNKEL